MPTGVSASASNLGDTFVSQKSKILGAPQSVIFAVVPTKFCQTVEAMDLSSYYKFYPDQMKTVEVTRVKNLRL